MSTPALPILQPKRERNLEPRPSWLRVRAPTGERVNRLRQEIHRQRLHTVCESAACPNMGECWRLGTATFMILGNHCTRACRFCDVLTSTTPPPVDLKEPERLVETVIGLDIRHVVITSVNRDDLPDGGAEHFVRCIQGIKETCPGVTVEVLTPDFRGDLRALYAVLDAGPAVFNHNIETVQRLTPKIRSGAVYHRSLDLLREAAQYAPHIKTKSGVMLGLGENDEEVQQTLQDLRSAHVSIVTLGQYLRPSAKHHPVDRYAHPDIFDRLGAYARDLGFAHVESGPLVRSSYHAERAID